LDDTSLDAVQNKQKTHTYEQTNIRINKHTKQTSKQAKKHIISKQIKQHLQTNKRKEKKQKRNITKEKNDSQKKT